MTEQFNNTTAATVENTTENVTFDNVFNSLEENEHVMQDGFAQPIEFSETATESDNEPDDLGMALSGELGEDKQKEAEAELSKMLKATNPTAADGVLVKNAKSQKDKKMDEAIANGKKFAKKPDWYKNLKFKEGKNRRGEYDLLIDGSVLENLVQIVLNDDVTKGMFAFNSFKRKVEVVKAVTLVGKDYQPGELKNLMFNKVARHIGNEYDVHITEARAAEVVMQAADDLEFNPVRNYVLACKDVYTKNTKDYIGEFFPRVLGTENSEYVKLATRILLNEMVAKAFDPYAKAEFSIDTIGSQGVGKTRVFEALFSLYNVEDVNKTLHQIRKEKSNTPYYLNNVSAINDKDAQFKISQNWGFIDDELAATRKTSFEDMKQLLSTQFFEVRAPYQRASEIVPRSAVIVRTTNENDYLKDKSGQRRFLPVLTDKEKKTSDISELFVGEIMAMIGQAVVEYEAGFDSNVLTAQELAMFENERDNFKYETPIDTLVDEYLQIKIPATWNQWLPEMKQDYIQDSLNGVVKDTYFGFIAGPQVNPSFKVENLKRREYITVTEVLFEGLKEPVSSRNSSKIKYALEHHPELTKEQRPRINGKRVRCFQFLEDETVEENA